MQSYDIFLISPNIFATFFKIFSMFILSG
jgi:hypothetical protein